MGICKVPFLLFRGLLFSRSNLILENLALRQQQTIKHPKLKSRNRSFWAGLSRMWPEWKLPLIVVKPETMNRRYRRGFKWYWRWKSRLSKVGRSRISKEMRDLISEVAKGTRLELPDSGNVVNVHQDEHKTREL